MGTNMAMQGRRDIKDLTTLDEHLRKQGTLEEFKAVAIKEVRAWQAKHESDFRARDRMIT
jgi:hypothetical protein